MLQTNNFKVVKNSILSKHIYPVYFFQGEETYYIDRLIDLLLKTALNETEIQFNKIIFNGSETSVLTIIHACYKYPIIGERQLIVVKEAQNLKQINNLIHYIKQPLFSTILVLYYKNKKFEDIKELINKISLIGVIFESKKIYGDKLLKFIIDYLKFKKTEINLQTAQLIIDYIGNDLNKLVNELDKFVLSLPNDKKRLTFDFVKKNSETNKIFNCFELQNAIAKKDTFKAYKITRFFEQNLKNYSLIFILNFLFEFFVNLIICHSEKNHSRQYLMNVLKFKWNFQINDYLLAIKQYDIEKIEENITLIRQTDFKIRKFKNYYTLQEHVLTELVFKLLH